MLRWLLKWRRKTQTHQITLYTRLGCNLCDEAKALLEKYREPFDLRIQEIDIDQDESLRERYDTRVPVIVIAGKERFRGRVNEVLLRRCLKLMA